MALTLTQQVETELAKDTFKVLELVDADFGNGLEYYWANQQISAADTFNSKTYLPRVAKIDELVISPGAEDDSATFSISNLPDTAGATHFFTDLLEQGVILEEGRFTVHLHFPDLDPPNNVLQNVWHGRVVNYDLKESTCDFNLNFGFIELERRALRGYETLCNSLFADDLHCPYNPLEGKGLPENRISGTATGGSATSIVDTGVNFETLGVQPGWLVFVPTETSTGRVTSVSGSTIFVEDWLGGNDPGASDTYIVGPPFRSCTFSKAACIARGMFGINDTQTAADLNTSTRRYYIGHLQPAAVTFEGKEQNDQGDRVPFHDRTATSNRGLASKKVPVVVGTFKKRELDLIGSASAGNFLHSLFVVGEGRCYNVGNVLVDGFPIDNVDRDSSPTQQHESFMKWGVEVPNGADDSSAVPGELTLEQQKEAVGSRQSRAEARDENLDTYDRNPFLLNNANGDGISVAGGCLVRIRTEPEGGARADAVPAASAQIIGKMVAMPPGSTAQADDGLVTDWTKYPNHVQVFYYFGRNTRFGGGFDDAQYNLTEVNAESDYCQEIISSTQSQIPTIKGTVAYGPSDGVRDSVRNNFISITSDTFSFGLFGGQLRITQAGKEGSYTITSVVRLPSMPDIYHDFRETIERGSANSGSDETLVYIQDAFPAGKIPVTGDSFEIIPPTTRVRRWKANGVLEGDHSVGEILEAIMDNCAGTFIQSDGKVSPIIRKAVDLDAAAELPVFTDKGTGRNVIRENGESSFSFQPDPVVNSIAVDFIDSTVDYQQMLMVIRNQESQEQLGKRFNENRRDKKESNLSLNLVTSRDEAARRGAIALRERGPLPGGRANGTVTWISPIHDAIHYQPIKDVVPIASDAIPSYIQFVRITRITINPDKATVTIEARPHFNQFYDDTADDLDISIFPFDSKFPDDEAPLPIRIESLTERITTNKQGVIESNLDGEITLP